MHERVDRMDRWNTATIVLRKVPEIRPTAWGSWIGLQVGRRRRGRPEERAKRRNQPRGLRRNGLKAIQREADRSRDPASKPSGAAAAFSSEKRRHSLGKQIFSRAPVKQIW